MSPPTPSYNLSSERGAELSLLDSFRIARVAEHSFLAGAVKPGCNVVDLGVNLGEFAKTMVSDFGCSVVGVEPEPKLFAGIPAMDGLTVEPLAIAADSQPIALYLSPSIYSATTDPRLADRDAPTVDVEAITLAALLDKHGVDRAALVKVDIEGAELPMLQSASLETLRRVDQFTIEFHDFVAPSHADDVLRAKQRLRSAGFTEMAFSTDNSDVLYINDSQITFSAAHRAAAAIAYKYPRGIVRNLRRRGEDRRRARQAVRVAARRA